MGGQVPRPNFYFYAAVLCRSLMAPSKVPTSESRSIAVGEAWLRLLLWQTSVLTMYRLQMKQQFECDTVNSIFLYCIGIPLKFAALLSRCKLISTTYSSAVSLAFLICLSLQISKRLFLLWAFSINANSVVLAFASAPRIHDHRSCD